MTEHLEMLNPLGASNHIGIQFRMLHNIDTPPVLRIIYDYNKGNYAAMETLNIDWEEALGGQTT